MSSQNAQTNAWSVDPRGFPGDGSPEEQLAFALGYAVLAPSGHNTQPWRFRIHGDVVEVRADRTCALPVLDPADRELILSCGAALFFLRIALRGVFRPRPQRPRYCPTATIRIWWRGCG